MQIWAQTESISYEHLTLALCPIFIRSNGPISDVTKDNNQEGKNTLMLWSKYTPLLKKHKRKQRMHPWGPLSGILIPSVIVFQPLHQWLLHLRLREVFRLASNFHLQSPTAHPQLQPRQLTLQRRELSEKETFNLNLNSLKKWASVELFTRGWGGWVGGGSTISFL